MSDFFECLWEIWRDITALEFFMRSAIAQHDWELDKFPKAPYSKGKIYCAYPKSFWHYSFELIVDKFNRRFPQISIPKEVAELRNAMAHWLIAQVNNSWVEELIKFKENSVDKELIIEFNLHLTTTTLKQLRQSIKELRQDIMALLKE